LAAPITAATPAAVLPVLDGEVAQLVQVRDDGVNGLGMPFGG